MTNPPSFLSSFTIPLVDEKQSNNSIEKDETAQIIILRNSKYISPASDDFLATFIDSIPFKNESTGISVISIDKAPHWSDITAAFPKAYFVMISGFSYLDVGLQIRPKSFLIQKFRQHYLLQTPPVEQWMNTKQIKLQIWNELKRVPNIKVSK
jgi:hypothetical protein